MVTETVFVHCALAIEADREAVPALYVEAPYITEYGPPPFALYTVAVELLDLALGVMPVPEYMVA